MAQVSDAPPRIWVRGKLPTGPAVAIVGARRARTVAVAAAQALAEAFARAGVAVVSGGAMGIDGAAHRGALAAGGATVVVLGTGVDIAYPPQHRILFEQILSDRGALVSQFDRGAEVARFRFPIRNRLIAGLSDAVVVIDAGATSGALYTARAARNYGRRVISWLGTPGCDALLSEGAFGARSVEEVLDRWVGKTVAPPPPPEDPRAAQLYAVLDAMPRDLGDLAHRAGVRTEEAMGLVVDLEMGGLCTQAAGGRYLRLA